MKTEFILHRNYRITHFLRISPPPHTFFSQILETSIFHSSLFSCLAFLGILFLAYWNHHFEVLIVICSHLFYGLWSPTKWPVHATYLNMRLWISMMTYFVRIKSCKKPYICNACHARLSFYFSVIIIWLFDILYYFFKPIIWFC